MTDGKYMLPVYEEQAMKPLKMIHSPRKGESMPKKRYRLSKSTFMRGLQCIKSLYLYKHHYDLQDETSAAQEAVFSMGHRVGELAQQLFPGGVDLSPEYENGYPQWGPSIERTAREIKQGTPVIYEAAVVHEGVFAAMDILVRDGNRWKAYEVKSGTSVKENYANDAALQYWVLTGAGVDLSDISIVHINTGYVRQGALDLHKLFAIESVLDHARARLDEIGGDVQRLFEIIAGKVVPDVSVGRHCEDPYTCSFMGHCWGEQPERSVFELSSGKAWKLHDLGISRLDDIPSDFDLNSKQRMQVNAAITGEPHIDIGAVRDFVASLQYPLYFLDFETLGPAIPLFDGASPYKHMPFQYSLHRRDEPGGELHHTAFLGDGENDPASALVEQLLSDIGPEGDVLVYTSYEKTQLNKLADFLPERASELDDLISRLVDLARPFSQRAYYTADMAGRYTIKKVLPALVPGMSYDGMDIADGMTASNAYEGLHYNDDPQIVEQTRKALLDYCELDTLAMVKILEVLEGV